MPLATWPPPSLPALQLVSSGTIRLPDYAAYGLPADRVNVVASLDLPAEAATYMHRVGRAGRFGTSGLAVAFVTQAELPRLLGFAAEARGSPVRPCCRVC